MNRPTASLLAVGLLTISACAPSLKLTPSDAPTVLSHQAPDAPDPGRPGPFGVLTLFYGNGTDQNRPEYRDSVSIRTDVVDASKLASLGGAAEERNGYWGFTPEEMPLNGQYLPTGRKVVVEDVSSLSFHGSHDGDVTSFHGLRIYVMRRRDLENDRFAEAWEQILQSYSIPHGDFQAKKPSLDLGSLETVRLVFDLALAGEVVVDQIGFSSLDPAFLSARVEKPVVSFRE